MLFINKFFLPVIVALLIDGWLHIGDRLLKEMRKVLSLMNSQMTESLNNITENTLPGNLFGNSRAVIFWELTGLLKACLITPRAYT